MMTLSALPRSLATFALGAVLFATAAQAREPAEITVSARAAVTAGRIYDGAPPAGTTHRLALTLVYFADGVWTPEPILGAAREVARILAQCGIRVSGAELVQVAAPTRFHDLDTPASRELARTLALPKPTVYFVRDTRHDPAFDAEAMGRGNTRRRPELADTVWVTRATRDLGVALAHELAHVLMDRGEHSDLPGNLMREDTTPANTLLNAAQCERILEAGERHGLVRAD